MHLIMGEAMSSISITKPNREQMKNLEKSKEDYNEIVERIKPFLKGSRTLQKTSNNKWHFKSA